MVATAPASVLDQALAAYHSLADEETVRELRRQLAIRESARTRLVKAAAFRFGIEVDPLRVRFERWSLTPGWPRAALVALGDDELQFAVPFTYDRQQAGRATIEFRVVWRCPRCMAVRQDTAPSSLAMIGKFVNECRGAHEHLDGN